MYSVQFTQSQIIRVQSKLDLTLVPSSIEKVKHFTKHLDSLIDPETDKPTRPLRRDEEEWIRNEKVLSALDFRYFCSRYATIRTTDERLTRFNLNIAQRITLDIIGEMEEEGLALHIQNLKARQLGVSTLYENMIAHRVLFYPNVNAVIASADDKRSTKLAKMVWTCYDSLPWWMLSPYTTNNVNEKVFGGHNSGISIQHGASMTGVARGDTPSVCHLSELPYWDDPKFSVDASLMKAIHDDPNKMVILESTANGMGDWWEYTWQYNKKNWPLRRSRFRPVFLPWFVDTEKYPTKTWLKKTPVPQDWRPDSTTQAHAQSANEYVQQSDYLSHYWGKEWTLPPAQQWFWEISREEAKDKKELQQFYQEMPANDIQAFQATGASPFEPELIEQIDNEKKEPWGVYGLIGDFIPESNIKFCPWTYRDLDKDKQPIKIQARWLSTLPTLNWTLIPLKFNGWDTFSWQSKIIIWEPPTVGETYGFGVDTSYGLGQDSSAIEGMRIGSGYRVSEQVLEFANNQISADDLWPYCMALGTWYSQAMTTETRSVQPRMVIECNGNGENTQNELRKFGYRSFHSWLRYDHKKMNIATATRLGWFTNSWSRPMAMSKFIKAIREGWVKVNSPRFIEEMKTLAKDENQQAIKAEQGRHDDLFMALCFNYFSNWVLEIEGLDNPSYNRNEDVPYAVYSNPQAQVEFPIGAADEY